MPSAVDGRIGFGMRFLRSPDGVAAYVDVGELVDIETPTISKDPVEVTHHQSPGRSREFIGGGLIDQGEFSIMINYNPGSATYATLESDINRTDLGFYEIQYPDGTSVQFCAVASELGEETPMEDKLALSFGGKVSGVPVRTPAAQP